MITHMQAALTTIFGIGVFTLATIALLNVACFRLHDVQKKDRKKKAGEEPPTIEADEFLYAYVYDSPSAFSAREAFRDLPTLLSWFGVGAVAIMQLLYVTALLAISPTSPNKQEYLSIFDVITWASATSYVLVLLGVAGLVSRRVYRVLNEVKRS